MIDPATAHIRDHRGRDRRAQRIAARQAKGAYLTIMVIRSRDFG